MPLPSPILDDRSFKQLYDELLARIPVYTKEWTDFNPSDPGITLLELFSFLGETLLFRFNQIPEATKLAFLKLLQVQLRPASAARALIQATSRERNGVLVEQHSPVSAGSIPFETCDELRTFQVSIRGFARLQAAAPASGEALDFTQAAIDAALLNPGEAPAYYEVVEVPLTPSAPDARPVDFGNAVDRSLWLAVLRESETTDLVASMANAVVNVGFIPDQALAGIDDVDACVGGSALGGPETVFEFSKTTPADQAPQYGVFKVEGDTTRGLTRQGVIRLRLPADTTQLGLAALSEPDLAGTRDFPPVIEDEEVAERVWFWIRAYRRKVSDKPLGRVLWVGANATEVVQTRKALPEFLGIGTAQPNQTYALIHKPVIDGSLRLEVEEAGIFQLWTQIDGFEASQPSDRHYQLDLEAGTVRFGTGLRGRAPQIGERIRAVEYRYGGGSAGNVASGKITTLESPSDLTVNNPLAALGGGASESLPEALERIPAELRRRDRAVTASDYRELARMVPGAPVGRAETLPLFHPPSRKLDAAGVVSVVVWPTEDRKHPNAPMPDRTLLRNVCAYLDSRRLITTELWVIPPTYKKIAIAIGIEVKPGFGVEAVRNWVEVIVRQYLAALPPLGPEGQGWPLGRTVFGREIEAAALQVEGVRFLQQDVRLASSLDGVVWEEASGSVQLAAWELPEIVQISVVEGEPLEPGAALTPPASSQVPVPIRPLKEEC